MKSKMESNVSSYTGFAVFIKSAYALGRYCRRKASLCRKRSNFRMLLKRKQPSDDHGRLSEGNLHEKERVVRGKLAVIH